MPSRKPAKKRKTPQRRSAFSTSAFERMLRQTDAGAKYVLKLYITGTTERSVAAIANIRSLCDEYLIGRYDLEVVDIYQQPSLAAGRQIVAAPTLVKEFPAPARRMVGDLANRDRVVVGLDLRLVSGRGSSRKTVWSKV